MCDYTNNDDLEYCPKCGVDLKHSPIPRKKSLEMYGGASHFKREIGIYCFDRTLAYVCPNCDKVVQVRYPELWKIYQKMTDDERAANAYWR